MGIFLHIFQHIFVWEYSVVNFHQLKHRNRLWLLPRNTLSWTPAAIHSGGASPKWPEQNASLETLYAEVSKMNAALHTVTSDCVNDQRNHCWNEKCCKRCKNGWLRCNIWHWGHHAATGQQPQATQQAHRHTVEPCGGFKKEKPSQQCETARSIRGYRGEQHQWKDLVIFFPPVCPWSNLQRTTWTSPAWGTAHKHNSL